MLTEVMRFYGLERPPVDVGFLKPSIINRLAAISKRRSKVEGSSLLQP